MFEKEYNFVRDALEWYGKYYGPYSSSFVDKAESAGLALLLLI